MSIIFSSKSNDEVIQYLKENSLLKSKFDCSKCGKETKDLEISNLNLKSTAREDDNNDFNE
jgi:hypothetical protein